MTSDTELLIRYAKQRDEAAFAELVHRHLGHVYSTALRVAGDDTHLAEDVAQEVFIALALNADSLHQCRALSGWLHTSARFIAAKKIRSEQRRRQREQIALTAMLNDMHNSNPDWKEVRPCLDEAIGRLGEADRDALLLRYFEKKSFAEVGAALGLSENAARMRVERALDKLRGRLARRGIVSSTVALNTTLAQHAVGPVPAELETQIVNQAITSGTALDVSSTSVFGSLSAVSKCAMVCALVLIVAGLGLALKPGAPPVIPAAAGKAEGQRSKFNAGKGPLYRCETCGKTYRAPCICCGVRTIQEETQPGVPSGQASFATESRSGATMRGRFGRITSSRRLTKPGSKPNPQHQKKHNEANTDSTNTRQSVVRAAGARRRRQGNPQNHWHDL
ncbi:MAG: sigma-70 family RNA polymerase sigma factor [Verrucomicrobia bacterium]|nr:sigma-70 family RNA polymerase sigma factor [Verrucomicrobiota bacterium]